MKIAQSLLLFLISTPFASQAMLLPVQFIPMAVAASGIAYIKVTSYFRDKRLAVIEGKVDNLQEGVTDLQKKAEEAKQILDRVEFDVKGLGEKLGIVQNQLDNNSDQLVTIVTGPRDLQFSVDEIKAALEIQRKSIQNLHEKHDTLHSLATNHSNQLNLLAINTETIAQRLAQESQQSTERHAHVLSLHEKHQNEFAQFRAEIEKLNNNFDILTQQVASIDNKIDKIHEAVVNNGRSDTALKGARTVPSFSLANKQLATWGNHKL